jgi:asparagine synthase (glutamine-hydrolysing)
MCGILGMISEVSYPDTLTFKRSLGTLGHRGPDNSGIYISDNKKAFLGFRRLAIIDLSERANQPMCNKNKKIWLVCNGEIYNFQDLRLELEGKGYIFKSNSDVEVILYAYEEWQEGCLNKLRGMFAFAIWDENDKALFVARDKAAILLS